MDPHPGHGGECPVSTPDLSASPSSLRATITPCPDGPLLVRGPVDIVDVDGKPVPGQRPTMALCRCGASARKPFCDGSHAAIGFQAP
ncbi:MAG: CDGSH iron-sulfur domain-containing protein [Austwickia sp.]|nr:CDGSH iron-sulfur domain-containing protein [Austwickia sp.]